MQPFLTVLAALGGLLVLAAAGLALIELAFRLYAAVQRRFFVEEVSRYDHLSPDYYPYLDWISDWDKPMFQYLPIGLRHYNLDNPIAPVRNNSLGFRCEEFGEPNPEELRIAVIGGSTAWGCGASSNETTLAGQLEALANADRRLLDGYRRARVYNLAQVDAHQTQDLLTIVFFLPRIRPHIVVSLTGWNELACNFTMRREALERYRVFYITEMDGWQPLKAGDNAVHAMRESFWAWGARRSELLRRLDARRRAGAATRRRSADACVALGTPLFVENLERIQTLSTAFGFRHFQFLQPHLYRKKCPTPSEAKAIELYDEIRPVQGGKETGDYLREHNIYEGIMDAVAGRQDVGVVVDTGDMFLDEKETMFFSLVHLTDVGYRRMAERVYETLVSYHASRPQEPQTAERP